MEKRQLPILMIVLLLVAAFTAQANPVDMRLARQVGANFVNANTAMRVAPDRDLQWVTTYRSASNDAAFHVFNTPKGFVIVSADDCATPILGYSEEGHFGTDNVPPQMEAYLQGFVEQIQYGIDNHLVADEATARQWELVQSTGFVSDERGTTAVQPLLADTWNQNCYYNNLCPADSDGPCGHVYAGCVATSCAQIMHFWGYPTSGTGSHSYTPSGYPQQTANFGATTYQWNNMPNSLTSSSSTTQVNAVATLIWHCGVAVDMMYGADGSGAYSADVATALVNYFGYSNDLAGIYKSDYSNAEWLNQIKGSLDLGRPVHYSGNDGTGQAGHAFVCDGYDNNNYLHFNWGWSGSYNNYFALDALTPGSYNFSSGNYAIINIHPSCPAGTSYYVTASASPSYGGTVNGSGYYACGSACTLTATPANGYMFCSWSEGGVVVSTEPTYSFTVMEDRNLVANFYQNTGNQCTLVFDLVDSYGDGWNGNALTVSYSEGCITSEQLTMESGSSASFTRNVVEGSHIVLGWVSGNWTQECSFTLSYDDGTMIYEGSNLSSSFSYEFDVNCSGTPPAPVNPIYVSTTPTNRNVILEEFTGRNCGYCPDGHRIANELMEANPNRFWPVNIHCGGYSPTSYPNMNTYDGNHIYESFTVEGFPSGVVNRSTIEAQGRYSWQSLVNAQLNQVSECNIGGEVSIDPETRMATISVEVYYTSNSPYSQNFLTIAMLQDSILGSQADYDNYNPSQWVGDQYCHMHVLRDIITGGVMGDAIYPTTQGYLSTSTYVYPIPEIIGSPNGVEVDLNNIYFMAWISGPYDGAPTRPILTACRLNNPNQPSNLCTITATASPANGGTVSGAGTYQQGQTCTLTATANSGYTFMNWTENGAEVSSSSSYTFVVSSNRNLVANFTDDNTIVVHDGTATSSYVPVYGFYADAYLKSETVYPATELGAMAGGSINSMRFFASQSNVSWGVASFQVFLKEVEDASISDYSGTDGATIVYEGPLSISGGTMDIPFTIPYNYNGGNLLVGIYNMVCGSYVSSTWYGETVNGASVQGYSYNGLDGITATQRNFIPKTMFGYEEGSVQTYSITATANPSNGGMVSGSGIYMQGDSCVLTATANEGYTFVNWTKNDNIVSTNATYSFIVNAVGNYVANFEYSGVTPTLSLPLVEHFDSPVLPDGWYIDNQGDNWSVSSTHYAGGTANEMQLTWDPQFNGVSRLVSPPIDLTGLSSVGFSFKHALDNYSGTNTIGIATSSDNGTTWHDAWSQGYDTSSSWLVNEVISTTDMGYSSVRFCIYFSGNSYNINDWYFDDIQIFALADLDLGVTAINMADYVGSGSQIVSFDVFNSGISSVTSLQATYEIDGESVTETFYVSIPSMEIVTLDFNTLANLTPGSRVLTISIDLVNGQEDDVVNNNTLSKTISVAIAAAEKIPMIEHFSSSTCGPCVNVNTQMHTFCDNNPGRFTYTKYQMNWPGNGDPYYTAEGGTRRFYYGVNAVPNLLLDGEDFGISMSQSDFDQQAAKSAMMDIRGSFNVSGNTINVKADIMPYIDVNARVYISVNEKVTTGNVGGNGETEFYHIFMKMLPDAEGVSQSFTASTIQHLEYSYDMSSTYVEEMNDLEVAIWVQDYNTKEIFNSRFAYEYTDVHPYPIQNLSLTGNNGVLDVTWDAPSQGNPIGYRVYLNGQVAFENTTGLSCTFYEAYGYYSVGVQALYANGNNSVTVYSDITCDPGVGTYLIETVANPADGGTVIGAGTYEQGQTCTLTALANNDYIFSNWSYNGNVVSTSPIYTFTVVEAGTYVANFTAITPPAPTELEVFAEYYPDANDPNSPYVKVYWTGGNSGGAFEAQIGDGTSTTGYFPFYTLYNYSISENLFMASELEAAGVTGAPMTSLSWYATNAPGYAQQGISIWMANVSDTELTTTSHTVDGMTLVYTGAMTPEVGWNEFVFNQGNFAWDGSSNVLIFVQRNNGEWNSSVQWQATQNLSFNAMAYRYQDSEAYDVTVSNSMYTSHTRPNIIMKSEGNRSVYNIYRANCDSSNPQLIASNVTGNQYIDYNWSGLAYGSYQYGVEVFETPVPETFWSNCIEKPIVIESFEISAVANPTNGGSVIGAGVYTEGTTCTLTAIPVLGYSFINWTLEGVEVSTDETYSFVVEAAGNYVAHFERMGFEITVSADPEEGGVVTGGGIYYYGEYTMFTAIPNEGYEFEMWTIEGNPDFVSHDPFFEEYEITGPAHIIAHFQRQTYEVAAYANPSEGGTVTGGGTYAYGDAATLMATANMGYAFINWTLEGVEVSTDETYSFVVEAAGNYVAHFERMGFEITVSADPEEGGVVTGGGIYYYGEYTMFTAIPNEGYEFEMWTIEGNPDFVSHDPFFEEYEITGPAHIIAHFQRQTYEVAAYANPSEGGTVTGGGTYAYGDAATLMATANMGYAFINWTLEGVEVSTDETYSFVVEAAGNYVANFELENYQIGVYANPQDGGVVTGAGTYHYGDEVTLTATPNEGYIFVNWMKDQIQVSVDATYTFSMTGADQGTYCAVFSQNDYLVTAVANPVEGGIVTGTGAYDYGDEVTLTATPNVGYNFLNWMLINGVVVSTEPTYTFIATQSDAYVANFELSEITQTTELAQGWNWWSSYVELGSNSLTLLEEGLGSNGHAIKSQSNGYASYLEGFGWYGSLISINNESTYQVQVDVDCQVSLTSLVANPANHPITLNPGWSWIGYPVDATMTVTDALAGITPQTGDMLKSQTSGFASYLEGLGWYGALNTLNPGMGLMYKSNNSNILTFTYPNGSAKGELKANQTTEGNHWQPNLNAFADNMSVMAVVELDNVELNGENYELAAFANGECRGSARLMYVEPLNRYMAFLTVAGDEVTELYFGLYNTMTGEEIVGAAESVNFSVNAVLGSFAEPYVVSFRGTTGVDEWARSLQVFPNPVDKGQTFSLGNSETGAVRVEIINALGVVETLRATSLQTIAAPNVAGVYTLRITVEGKGTCYRKLVVR